MDLCHARVSTAKQDLEREGIPTARIFLDKKSGATTDRPGMKAALEYAREGDVLVVHTLQMLEHARDDVTAFATFPTAHWRQIWSTNPLERVNKEIKRRTDVVGVFPSPAALLRLAGAVLIEQHDEWGAAERRYFSEHSMKQLDTKPEEVVIPAITAA